jgi:hypothetical protein
MPIGNSWMHFDLTHQRKHVMFSLLCVYRWMSYIVCKISFCATPEQRKWLSNGYETWRCSLRQSRGMKR